MDFRLIDDSDIRFAWAAYKLGAMRDVFPNDGMSAEEFKEAFQQEVLTKYHIDCAWTLLAETKKGFHPVGFVFGYWSHPISVLAPYVVLNVIQWMPWARPRNRVESAVYFFNKIRDEIPMIGYAREPAKKFFETIMKHGIMRRVGTSFNVFPDAPAAVYETRRSQGG